jgi:hypothetical protein
MSRTLDWSKTYKNPVGNIQRGLKNQNTAGSMREAFAKGQVDMAEQQKAMETLQKALPIMKNILLQRMTGHNPIRIVRPLPYTTESLDGGNSEEEDDGFYAIKKSESFNAKFKSIRKVIPVGTELTFMNLEKSMNQLWFKTDKGEEIGIYLEEQNNILIASDIYDLVSNTLTE